MLHHSTISNNYATSFYNKQQLCYIILQQATTMLHHSTISNNHVTSFYNKQQLSDITLTHIFTQSKTSLCFKLNTFRFLSQTKACESPKNAVRNIICVLFYMFCVCQQSGFGNQKEQPYSLTRLFFNSFSLP
jgi:hypothetical protein